MIILVEREHYLSITPFIFVSAYFTYCSEAILSEEYLSSY